MFALHRSFSLDPCHKGDFSLCCDELLFHTRGLLVCSSDQVKRNTFWVKVWSSKNNVKKRQSPEQVTNSGPFSASLGLFVLTKQITEKELLRSFPKGLSGLASTQIKPGKLTTLHVWHVAQTLCGRMMRPGLGYKDHWLGFQVGTTKKKQ